MTCGYPLYVIVIYARRTLIHGPSFYVILVLRIWANICIILIVNQYYCLGRIEAGEEACANYIDDFDTTYNTRDKRQQVLSGWSFQCGCAVCSLSGEKLRVNNEVRWYDNTAYRVL